MGIARNVFLAASINPRLRETLPRYRFVRKAVARFMPGEDAESALEAASRLHENGIATVLTHLGENVMSATEATEVAQHYREVLDQVNKKGLDSHISIKLTQLGLDVSTEIGYRNLLSIVGHAAKLKNFVWIDMEATAYTDVTIELFQRARSEYSNVGVCLQAYLRRTAADLKRLLPLSPAIRLVKGAYAEPLHLVFQNRRDVDENYLTLGVSYLRSLKSDHIMLGCGTHDRRLIRRIQEEAAKLGFGKEVPEFQMLYGIQREEQIRLAREGYKVRVLISYGNYWFPWYMRRLAERPANVLFVLKNIFS